MNRRKSRRARQVQLVLTYIVMVGLVAIIVTMLAFFVNGYRFNSKSGQFVQGGLVQLDSKPSGASITIDGKPFGNNTQTHATLFAGTHAFTMQKSGYDVWRDNVHVTPGSVVWLTYPRLVPTELSPEVVEKYRAVSSALAAPDGKYIAFATPSAKSQLVVANISGDTVKDETITIDQDDLIAPAESKNSRFTIMDWSSDSHYVLVKHTYGKNNVAWLRVDTTGSHDVRNITSELALDFSEMQFRPHSSSQIYGLTTNNDLRRVDLTSSMVSAPLESDVAYFVINPDKTITYMSTYNAKTRVRTVGYISDGSSHGMTLRSYTDNGKVPLHIATSKYYDTRYIAISYAKKLDVFEANVPNSDNKNGTSKLQLYRSFGLPEPVSQLKFRTSGRFVIASGSEKTSVYDFGLDNFTTMEMDAKNQSSHWLDNYIAWTDAGGTLTIVDFDGANRHDIMPVVSGLDATLSPNGKYLYGFSQSKDGDVLLTRVRMIID